MDQKDYIIGKIIRFSPSNETLSLFDNPDTSIVLTPACNRLLIYMISNQGVVLSRDAIFSTLWEQYGSTPSNSSLNTYMSLIRKSFVNLGFDNEVITTVPKTGFLFNPDVVIEEFEVNPGPSIKDASHGDVSYRSDVVEEEGRDERWDEFKQGTPVKNESFANNVKNVESTRKKAGKWLFYFAGAVLLTILIYTFTNYGAVPPVTPVKAGQIDNCDIMFLPVHAGDSVMFTDYQARFMVKQSGFTCKPGGVFYLYADKRVTANQSGKVYVSYCELKNKNVKNCTDYMGGNVRLPDSSSN